MGYYSPLKNKFYWSIVDLKVVLGVPIVVQWKQIQPGTMRMWVQSLASLSGSGIWCCLELWCSLQMQLGSRMAVAVAQTRGCSSNLTPSLGISINHRCVPKKKKKKKKVVLVSAKNISYLFIHSFSDYLIQVVTQN